MKKYIKHSILALIIMVMSAACSEEFIEISPKGQQSEDAFEPVAAVTACYNAMCDYNARWSNYKLAWSGDITSDDSWKGGRSASDQKDFLLMSNFTTIPSNGIVKDHWRRYYERLYKMNWTIFNLGKNETLEEDQKLKLIGEVKFLRAYHYFLLVRAFGGVPLVLKPLSPDEHNLERATEEQVYAQIELDLKDAASVLPKRSEYPSSYLGRITSGAAYGLLGKVYMYQGKWTECEDALYEVIKTNEYSLKSDYAGIFEREYEHGNESVFEITYAPNDARSNPTYHAVGSRSRNSFGGWGLNCPTTDLVESYEEGDPRLIHTVVFHGDSSEGVFCNHTGYDNTDLLHSRKTFKPLSRKASANANDGENIRVLRYADVLLMYAEALNENNKAGEALTYLNMVRERARNSSQTDHFREFINYEREIPSDLLPDITTTDKDELRSIIWHERRVELAMENERFFDLVRQGRAGEVLRAFGAKYDTDKGAGFVDGKHERWPIPQEEIDKTNGLLDQNPQY